ncbi:hypothetical protein Droror1_Dr00010827 [Drosera rotundifolia]
MRLSSCLTRTWWTMARLASVWPDPAPTESGDERRLTATRLAGESHVVERCHSLGVIHRDLKPENSLLVGSKEDSLLKTIDFGMLVFFSPRERFGDVVGSPYYVVPKVLRKHYGPECDGLMVLPQISP